MNRLITRIAPDVGWLPVSFANVYFVGRPGAKWVLVDAGYPGRANEIIQAADARFGGGARPQAIVLTHGHIDHAGSALSLAQSWDVPIFVYRLELPFLTGRSPYPPADPTVGGALAFLSRFFPSRSRDLSAHVRELPGKTIPGLPDWRWIATPGHSPGHISFFRDSDRVLLAGDAFATVDMDSWSGLITARQELARPQTPFTMNWEAARDSVNQLVRLRPKVVACGHGIPISGPDLAEQLEAFATTFRPPRRGRYARRPAETNENGIVDLPPAPMDPVPLITIAGILAMGIAIGSGYLDNQRGRS